MKLKDRRLIYVGFGVVMILLAFFVVRSGVLNKKQTAQTPPVTVKAMQVTSKDTPINYEFVGKVQAKNEVKILARISGKIVGKMVKGGDSVYKGQPLFRIDNKQYRSAIRSAQANLAKSQAALNNSQRNVTRYKSLAEQDAIAQQTLDTEAAQADQDLATVQANEASLRSAEEDNEDTLIVSPVDGRIDVNDLNVGDYVVAGSTTLANVSTTDPVVVQFSISENEYIKFIQMGNGTLPDNFKNNLKLTLSDGSEYPLSGYVDQIDKGIGTTTGTITIKAIFSNPQKFLLPGMFARVVAAGEVRHTAILIPQRAVKELLDNTFVFVINTDNKVEQRAVKLGDKVGNMILVEEGISDGDKIVVDGIDKVKAGSLVNVTMIEPDNASTNPVQQ
ncbi:MAG: efflux transporter, family, subunit [Firmicutes bacterium]|nr:efflux transporter, family, subunit [Bacillota bacterium]